jgi:hypothetical protein
LSVHKLSTPFDLLNFPHFILCAASETTSVAIKEGLLNLATHRRYSSCDVPEEHAGTWLALDRIEAG